MALTKFGTGFDDSADSVDEDYVDRVHGLARLRDGTAFFNASPGHVSVVLECLIAGACRSVSILAGNLDPRVYGRIRVLRQSERFLDRPDCSLRIMLEGEYPDVLEANAFLQHFRKRPNLELRFVPKAQQERYDFHFVVADGESYRFEPDKSKSAAIVAFGDRKGASNLEGIVGELWALSASAA